MFHLPKQCAEFAVNQSVVQDDVTVPWDLLDKAALREKLLVNSETFSHMKTLDPMRMTPRDVYEVLDLLLKGQTSGVQPLEFSTGDNFDSNANLQDDDISELPDPPTLPKSRTASSGESGIDNATSELDNDISGLYTERHPASPRNVGIGCTIVELDNDVSYTSWAIRTVEGEPRTASSRNIGIDGATETDNGTSSLRGSSIQSQSKGADGTEPHNTSAMAEIVSDHSVRFWAERNTESDPHTAIGPHLQDSLPPLSAPVAASPVVGLPFKSPPPSSESVIEVAIQNVARAGYLSITHATAINADQTPSQQGVKVTSTNSKCKKRTHEEAEQEDRGKQTKKRAKITIPAREQSLRYTHQLLLSHSFADDLIVVSKIPTTRTSM